MWRKHPPSVQSALGTRISQSNISVFSGSFPETMAYVHKALVNQCKIASRSREQMQESAQTSISRWKAIINTLIRAHSIRACDDIKRLPDCSVRGCATRPLRVAALCNLRACSDLADLERAHQQIVIAFENPHEDKAATHFRYDGDTKD